MGGKGMGLSQRTGRGGARCRRGRGGRDDESRMGVAVSDRGSRVDRALGEFSASTSFEILVCFRCEPIEFAGCHVPFQLVVPRAGRVVVEPACERAKLAF